MRKTVTYTGVDATLVTTAETVVATLTGVATQRPGQVLSFHGEIGITSGVGTTGVTLRVRQDSLTGAVVGEASPDTLSGAAGTTETHTIDVADNLPGEFSGRTYVLTAQQVGATGNGTATRATFTAESTP